MTHPTLDNETFELPIPGAPLLLRPLRLSDAPNLRDRCADQKNVEFLPHLQGKENQTVAEVETWIKSVQNGWNKDSFFLVVVDTHCGGVIGEGPLGYINWEKKEAESGVMLDHRATGKGVATLVLNESTDFAFRKLGLDRVNYGTLKDNKAMAKVLTDKLKVKGRPTESIMKDGRTELRFVFTKEEWLAASP